LKKRGSGGRRINKIVPVLKTGDKHEKNRGKKELE